MPAIDKLIKTLSLCHNWEYINTSSETWFICLAKIKMAKSHRTLTWTMTNFWLWQRCQQPKIHPVSHHLPPRNREQLDCSAGETLPAKVFQSYFWLRSTKHTQSRWTQKEGKGKAMKWKEGKPQTKLSAKTNFILMRSDSIRCRQTETEKETLTENLAQFKF